MSLQSTQRILAIDTSCDDTSAAVVSGVTVLSNVVASQTELHKKYGGVFPTVAKGAHKEQIAPVVRAALQRAHTDPHDLTAVAVTLGPGLAPALEVGIRYAEEFAAQYQLPLIPVNHMEGHLLSVLAEPNSRKSTASSSTENQKPHQSNINTEQFAHQPQLGHLKITFPTLGVLVSGGHTEFVLATHFGEYTVLGATLDDAAGECLDKIGRMLNLGYPAGPVMEEFAKKGNPQAINFPLPLTQVKTFDMSFSGLKTFARNLIESETASTPLTRQHIYDFCASTQYSVFRHITYKLEKLLAEHPEITEIWLGGGVAANMTLRKMLRQSTKLPVRTPYTKKLCADNAAMIGIAAQQALTIAQQTDFTRPFDRQPRLSFSDLP